MTSTSIETVEQTRSSASVGRSNFVQLLGLDMKARDEAVSSIIAAIAERSLDVIRLAFVDTHGKVRVRPIEARHFASACRNGVPFTTAFFAMDSANNIFQNVFAKDGGFGRDDMGGAGDMLAIPDPSTFRILPWAANTGWILCDLFLKSGMRCPFDPRGVMKEVCKKLGSKGFDYLGGVEVEFHVFKVDDPNTSLSDCTQPAKPASVSALQHGYQYLSEEAVDGMEAIIDPFRKAVIGIGLPLRTLECEWGPGQLEITLDPMTNVQAADAVIMMRAAIKQVARRKGLIASFMTKPNLPNVYSCGWHLHQSLADAADGRNVFSAEDALMSPVGLGYTAGLLEHAPAATAFSNPSINGYKRLAANALAPKRAVWSDDNKAAMLRIVGGPTDPATHIENRSGEPMANPYLYMATQILAGLDGVERVLDPGPPLDDPYGQIDKPLLPINLNEAINALAGSAFFRKQLGDEFVNHYVSTKRHEIGRFQSFVTDWEQQEYFEAY